MLRDHGILYEEGALTPDECRVLIELYEDTQERSSKDDFWDGRVVQQCAVPEDRTEARAIMRRARDYIIAKSRQFFARDCRLYTDGIQLVTWHPGMAMPPHADNCHPDPNEPHRTPWREYGAVVYLNDDFDGGVLYFPDNGARIAPRTGAFSVFPGGASHFHGVSKVTGGIRYTMVMFLTSEIEHATEAERTQKPRPAAHLPARLSTASGHR